jgi:hypothetical protein
METGMNGDWNLVVGNTVVLYRMFDSPMWQFLKKSVIKKGDFSPGQRDNSGEVNDEESQSSDKYHCTSITMDTRKVRLCKGLYTDWWF